jgi:hypothetical protein
MEYENADIIENKIYAKSIEVTKKSGILYYWKNKNTICINHNMNTIVDCIALLNDKEYLKFNKIMNSIEEDYNNLIYEIRKYSKRKIIVITYPDTNKDNYYLKKGIRYLNEILMKNEEIIYIDSYKLLANRDKYFSNPHSFYPNRYGYLEISKEIIIKTLEK